MPFHNQRRNQRHIIYTVAEAREVLASYGGVWQEADGFNAGGHEIFVGTVWALQEKGILVAHNSYWDKGEVGGPQVWWHYIHYAALDFSGQY